MNQINEKTLQRWQKILSLLLIVGYLTLAFYRFFQGVPSGLTRTQWQTTFYIKPALTLLTVLFLGLSREMYLGKRYEGALIFSACSMGLLYLAYGFSIWFFPPLVLILLGILALQWYRR